MAEEGKIGFNDLFDKLDILKGLEEMMKTVSTTLINSIQKPAQEVSVVLGKMGDVKGGKELKDINTEIEKASRIYSDFNRVKKEGNDLDNQIRLTQNDIKQQLAVISELRAKGANIGTADWDKLTAAMKNLSGVSAELVKQTKEEIASLGGINEAAKSAEGSTIKLRQQVKDLNLEKQKSVKGTKEEIEITKKYIEAKATLITETKEETMAIRAATSQKTLDKLATKEGTKSLFEMKQELRALMGVSLSGKTAAEIKKIQTQIAELKNDIKETGQAMNMLDKGEILGGWVKTAQGAVGAFGALTAAADLFGVKNEWLQEIEKKSMQLIQLMMGLEQARQLLIDGGGIKTLKTLWATTQAHLTEVLTIKAKTVATVAGAAATEVAAISTQKLTAMQKAWNAAVAANPIGAFVVALLTLGLAIAGVSAAMKEQTAAQMVNKKVMEEYGKIVVEPLANLTKLEIAVKNTTLGTKEHTEAVIAYNKNAKENNLTQVDLNKTYNETLVILGKNRTQLLANLKVKAQEIAYTNLLTKAIELEQKFKSGDYKFFRKGELMDEIVTVNMQLKELEKTMFTINTNKVDGGEIFVSKDPTKEITREFKMLDGTIKEVKGNTDKLGDSNKTVTKTTKEYKKSVDELNQSLKEGINADDEKQKRLDARIKQEKELTDVLKEQEKDATARYEKEAVRRMLQEDKGGSSFGDMDLEGQMDEIINGKNTKAWQEFGDQIVETVRMIADAKMEAAQKDYELAETEVQAHDDKLKRLDDELKKEQEKAAKGIANNASLIKNQIATEKALQDIDKQKQEEAKKAMQKAFDMKKKADKAATRIDYLKELGSIAMTAAGLGFPYGIVYGVLMAGIASVQFSKRLQAINAETLKLEKGGSVMLRGRRHSEGGIRIGDNVEAEDGEMASVFSRKATSKHGKEIIDFERAVNSDRLTEQINKWALYKNLNMPMTVNMDFKNLEKKQDDMIREQRKANEYLQNLGDRHSPDGKTVIKSNGTIIRYV